MSDVAPTHEPGRHPDQPPPVATVGVLGWLRKNLFSSWLNSIVTIVAVYFLYVLVPPIVDWIVTSSVVSGSNRSVCDMGRALSRMGEAMERADLAAIESEATQDRLVEVTDFYAQFALGWQRGRHRHPIIHGEHRPGGHGRVRRWHTALHTAARLHRQRPHHLYHPRCQRTAQYQTA